MEGKKSRINNNIDLVDRISALPDYILGHILSFLPTNKAVATSILSKRWKFAWVTVHSLEFDNPMKFFDIMKEKEEEIMEFVRFVNRVLLLNDVGSLIKFSLTCNCVSISPQIISWINTAITRNVHHLYLSVENTDMPASLFSCDSLRSLVLHGFMYIRDPIEVCLTRLESLEIQCVRFDSEETCEKLISGCPILHYLNLWIENYRGDADDDITCIISSASLRHLEIYFMNRSRLKLKAPSVEYLRLGGYYISEIFVEKSLSSLVEAYFNIPLDEHDFLNNSILEVVRAFDCARFLTLSAGVMRALSRDTVKLSSKLKRLVKLETNILYCDWSSLRDLIQNSDNLEVLTINQFEKVRGVSSCDRSKWISLVEVPRCLSKSLKKIVFEGYHGIVEDEHEMIGYMLTHGSVLEDVRITLVGKMTSSKFKSVHKIGEYPRKSPCCLVKIFGQTSNGQVEVCFSA